MWIGGGGSETGGGGAMIVAGDVSLAISVCKQLNS